MYLSNNSYSKQMLEPIKFRTSNGLNINKLKLQIDRRMMKITQMVKQKLGPRLRHKTISHIPIQTQICQQNNQNMIKNLPNEFIQPTKTSRKMQDIHTRQNSDYGIFINENSESNIKITSRIGTQLSINCEEETKKITISSLKKLNKSLIIDLSDNDEKNNINQQADKENSLNGSLTKKNIQTEIDDKIFNNGLSLKQSILNNKKSSQGLSSESRQNEVLMQNCYSIKSEKLNEACAIKSADKNVSEYVILIGKDKKVGREEDSLRSGVKKNILMEKTKKNVQKLQISAHTKLNMINMVQQILNNQRNQTTNYNARINLLKRIEQKYNQSTTLT